MSCKELIESLKKAADERLKLLWQEAEAEAEKIKADAAGRLVQLREEAERKKIVLAADLTSRAVSEANRRVRIDRLSAEKALSGRLYEQAVALLPALRNRSSDAAFAVLAAELPHLAWQTVRVNPGDTARAKKCFPGAEIVPDRGISGGMDVFAQNGAIRVVNTFEKRLERAWEQIEPELIRDVYLEVEHGGSSAAAWGPGVPDRISAEPNQRQEVTSDL